MEINQVYQIVAENCVGFDAIYEDYIIELVGVEGLHSLKENRLVETCGVVNNRQLYVLTRKND